jgi:Holin of 3TMs, for gene-transfer release
MAGIDPISAVSDLAGTVINKIWPDKSEIEKQQLAAAVELVHGQLNIDQAEATNPNMFVAGWRPYVGWVCGAALTYTYLIYPLLTWWLAMVHPELHAPKLGNDSMLYELLTGMLGMGALRTLEKVKGVA